MTEHTLFITNDFPPRDGGIQTFIYELVKRFEPRSVTVLASDYEGAKEFDRAQPFRVVRAETSVLLPTPATKKLARQLIVETGATRVVYGAAAPLGLLTPALRAMGVKTFTGITHGHEAGWSITPVTRQLLRRIGKSVDVLTYLGNYTREKIGRILPQENYEAMRQLAPAVDTEVFSPANRTAGQRLRIQAGLENKRVIVCVSRLMERKGQDSLINAMPLILAKVPNAHLLIVGGGPYEDALHSLVTAAHVEAHVTFTGKVAFDELAQWYAAADVFAMPCRTRNAGWDVEGLGIVFLEASATGLPVIAGNSGGAPDAVVDGVTGFVVDGQDLTDIASRITQLLNDPQLCEQFGLAGRAWVQSNWTWERSVARLQALLDGRDPDVLDAA